MGWVAGDWVAVGSLAQAGILGAAVLYARGQVEEARALRAEQTRPYVVVYAELNAVARSLIDLVVKNVGRRPAHDVTIAFTPPLLSSLRGGGRLEDPQKRRSALEWGP